MPPASRLAPFPHNSWPVDPCQMCHVACQRGTFLTQYYPYNGTTQGREGTSNYVVCATIYYIFLSRDCPKCDLFLSKLSFLLCPFGRYQLTFLPHAVIYINSAYCTFQTVVILRTYERHQIMQASCPKYPPCGGPMRE
jgi:hypothetical protein